MCNCIIHELLNVSEDPAQRIHTICCYTHAVEIRVSESAGMPLSILAGQIQGLTSFSIRHRCVCQSDDPLRVWSVRLAKLKHARPVESV